MWHFQIFWKLGILMFYLRKSLKIWSEVYKESRVTLIRWSEASLQQIWRKLKINSYRECRSNLLVRLDINRFEGIEILTYQERRGDLLVRDSVGHLRAADDHRNTAEFSHLKKTKSFLTLI